MRRALTSAAVLAACALFVSLIYTRVEPILPSEHNRTVQNERAILRIGVETIRVEIVDTAEERERGLSGRLGLAKDEGMLFVFPEEGRYGFWMKDMRFPIDILWISSEGIITHIEERVAPATYPEVFMPRTSARYVLELPAGYVEEHAAGVGDIVRL